MMFKNLLTIIVLSLFIFTFAACESKGPVEKAAEKIDQAVEKTADKVEDATEGVKERVE